MTFAATSWAALVGVNFKANFCGHCQYKNLTGSVAVRMPNEGVFSSGAGCRPEHDITDLIGHSPVLLFRRQSSAHHSHQNCEEEARQSRAKQQSADCQSKVRRRVWPLLCRHVSLGQ